MAKHFKNLQKTAVVFFSLTRKVTKTTFTSLILTAPFNILASYFHAAFQEEALSKQGWKGEM